jgi:hypothetical protein
MVPLAYTPLAEIQDKAATPAAVFETTGIGMLANLSTFRRII